MDLHTDGEHSSKMAKLVREKEAVVTKYQPSDHAVHARMAFSHKGKVETVLPPPPQPPFSLQDMS